MKSISLEGYALGFSSTAGVIEAPMTIGRAVWIALGALAGVVGLAHVRSPETGFAAAAPSMTADPDATNDEGAPLLQQAMLRQDLGKFRNLLDRKSVV